MQKGEKLAKKAKSSSPRKRSSSAAGSYRGYSLQATRCLHYLLAPEPPESVCVEVIEDVSSHKPDGSVVAEQAKSYRSSNPLSDRAVSLWKTLRNWVDAVTHEKLDPKNTNFVLYAPNATPSDLAQALNLACDPESIAAARAKISDLRNECSEGEWQEHAKVVDSADDMALESIIENFSVDSPTGSPADTLPPLLSAKLVSADAVEDVLTWAHGWIKTRIDSLLEAGHPARVAFAEFHSALLDYVKSHDRLVVLRSYAGVPDNEDVNNHLAYRCYVRQLRIIDMEDVDLLAAVNDYLRSYVDRTEWARRGFITEQSLVEFEQELEATWRNKRRKVSLSHPDVSAQQQGQLLYSDCMEHTLELDGLPTPPAFLRGSMHSIADDRTIGWHPDYSTLLETVSEERTDP